MAACPNCGRRTLRTKDWVCQWCGYPLLGGGYKPIDKTYKEIQDERNPSFRPEEQETEPEYKDEPEPEPEPEPKPEPKWRLKKALKPSYQPKPQPEPEPEPEDDIQPNPEPRPVPRPAPQPTPELAPQTRPELLPRSRPEPVLLPKAEPVPQPEQPPPALSRPEPPPAPPPEPLTVPSLNSIVEGSQLTIDQIDALFRADNVGTNVALKNKTIIIKGFVNKIFIRDHLEIRYLILTGARKVVWTARCQFEKESSGPMSHLTEGQAVALRGKYEGYGKNIIFKDCTLLASN